MRVRIIFILKNKGAFVPFHHQFLLAQLIKGIIIKGGDEKYRDYLHYNFSGLKGQTKISRNGLHYFSNRVTLVFSCLNKQFLDYVIVELFKLANIEVGNLVLIPESVEIEANPTFQEEMKYICISPIVLIKPSFNDSESKRFINPQSDEFSDILFESTILRMQALGRYSESQLAGFSKFQLIPDEDYLRKIHETQKKFARIYPVYDQDVKYEVRGYTFPFILYAAHEVQEFVFNEGIGSFTHKGFGMLDIANSDPSQRTTPYFKNLKDEAPEEKLQ
ncbi:MAG: CRISPR-associated endoribonuclease Cas6 [Cyclobacteriaceae bacterium]|nr:CRISPR-associated endoribonuclease Cas6 [Cyclobacteriaceae bacterium]